jgi:hypothetical protein
MTEGIDRRNPIIESRRYTDCFPSGGAMVLVIGIASLLAFALGVAIGAWWF